MAAVDVELRGGLNSKLVVRFEVFTTVTMKNAVFWDVTPRDSFKNRRFGGTSVHTRVTRRNFPEDGIIHSKLVR
jgi:hypothetical protein